MKYCKYNWSKEEPQRLQLKLNLRGLRVRFATLETTDAAEIAEAAVKDVAACLN